MIFTLPSRFWRYRQTFLTFRRRMHNCFPRNWFFDFDKWAAKESDKVENYRFLRNCWMETSKLGVTICRFFKGIFIKIHTAVFEKPIIFDFVLFLCHPFFEIEKSVFLKAIFWISHSPSCSCKRPFVNIIEIGPVKWKWN